MRFMALPICKASFWPLYRFNHQENRSVPQYENLTKHSNVHLRQIYDPVLFNQMALMLIDDALWRHEWARVATHEFLDCRWITPSCLSDKARSRPCTSRAQPHSGRPLPPFISTLAWNDAARYVLALVLEFRNSGKSYVAVFWNQISWWFLEIKLI